jgi:hypothetical protein
VFDSSHDLFELQNHNEPDTLNLAMNPNPSASTPDYLIITLNIHSLQRPECRCLNITKLSSNPQFLHKSANDLPKWPRTLTLYNSRTPTQSASDRSKQPSTERSNLYCL